MPDVTNSLAEALLALCNGSSAIQALCGRSTACAVAFGDFELGRDPLPVLLVEDTGQTDSDIENDLHVGIALAAMAASPDADAITGQLLDAAEAAITNAGLQGAGLNAGLDPTDLPWPRDRVDVTDAGIDYLVQRTMALGILISPE